MNIPLCIKEQLYCQLALHIGMDFVNVANVFVTSQKHSRDCKFVCDDERAIRKFDVRSDFNRP